MELKKVRTKSFFYTESKDLCKLITKFKNNPKRKRVNNYMFEKYSEMSINENESIIILKKIKIEESTNSEFENFDNLLTDKDCENIKQKFDLNNSKNIVNFLNFEFEIEDESPITERKENDL